MSSFQKGDIVSLVTDPGARGEITGKVKDTRPGVMPPRWQVRYIRWGATGHEGLYDWSSHSSRPTEYVFEDMLRLVPRENPRVGMHPDLFEGTSARWVPMSELSRKELLALPRRAYSDEEWEELDDDIREYIYEHDPDSKELIDAFARPFVEIYKSFEDEDYLKSYTVDMYYDYFENELAEATDKTVRQFDEADDIIGKFVGEGYAMEDVEEKLLEAYQDNNNFIEEIQPHYYYARHEKAAWYWPLDNIQLYLEPESTESDGLNLVEVWQAMKPDEQEKAIGLVNERTDDAWGLSVKSVDRDMAHRWPTIQNTFDTGRALVIYPDWEKIENDVGAELEQIGKDIPEPEALPPEARVHHRFDDGSYAIELVASELPEEGKKMRMCVGRPDMGYIRAVKDGDTRIVSLRTKAGRPRFTFEIATYPGEIVQIKGKANRLPGFDLGKAGEGKLKEDEVQKVIKVVEVLGFDPRDVDDLEPALRALEAKGSRKNPRRRVVTRKAACGHSHPHANPSDGLDKRVHGFCAPVGT